MKNRVLGLKLKLKRKKTKFITGEDPACKKTVVKWHILYLSTQINNVVSGRFILKDTN